MFVLFALEICILQFVRIISKNDCVKVKEILKVKAYKY